jgi:ADP-ribose pyrophosphatase YjhB (NUDIX family)
MVFFMATIICYDIHGNGIPVAPEALLFHPAVYGLFIENNQILLLKQEETGLWYAPGAVLVNHETPAQAVRQAFRQVTGMTPTIGPLLCVEDQYFIDGERRAWHLSAMYYGLQRPSTAAALTESERIHWVSLADLKREQMQFGFEAIQAALLQLKL